MLGWVLKNDPPFLRGQDSGRAVGVATKLDHTLARKNDSPTWCGVIVVVWCYCGGVVLLW